MDPNLVNRRVACLGFASAIVMPAAGRARIRAAVFDARVGSGGTHESLAAALADAPAGQGRYRILLGRGRWEEKLTVVRPNVEIVGADRWATMLTASTAAGHAKPGGGTWGTYSSATLTVEAPGFTLRNLTVENGFDYLANLRTGALANAQAVALALGDAADRSLIDGVDLIGHQDTFYLRAGRALVTNSLISGSIDFIFGGAAAIFERCEIRSRVRPGEPLQGYIAAPSTPRIQSVGLVFERCRLTREVGVSDGSVWLGRPWRAGGNTALLGSAAYLSCSMGPHIHRDGWTWMNYRRPGGPEQRLEAGDARLYEYRSRGPGARSSPARRQLSQAEARLYSRAAILRGWNPVQT